MFGIGVPELIVILAVALVVIGPKKLPDLAKSLGKALGEFKRATNDLKQSIEQEAGLDEVRDSLKKTDRDIRRAFDPGPMRPASHSEAAAADSKDADARSPEADQRADENAKTGSPETVEKPSPDLEPGTKGNGSA